MNNVKSAETKRKLFCYTVELIKKKGLQNTTMRDISRYANVNHSLIYYYYPNGKYDIAYQVFKIASRRIESAINNYFKENKIQLSDEIVRWMISTRLIFREALQTETDFNFYIDLWSEFVRDDSERIKKFAMLVKDKHPQISFDDIISAEVISDYAWLGFYKERIKGKIEHTDKQIRDCVDKSRLLFLGFTNEEITAWIDEATEIVNAMPLMNIHFLDV